MEMERKSIEEVKKIR